MSIEKLINKYEVNKKQSDYAIKKEIVHKMKKLIHSHVLLDVSCEQIQHDFIDLFEGYRLEAYYEKTGKKVHNSTTVNHQDIIAVGYGFNMSRAEAHKEWSQVLPETLFHKVKKGHANLTEAQAKMLLKHSLMQRRGELQHMFHGKWDVLDTHIQIALESVYYNSPGLFAYNANNNLKTAIEAFMFSPEKTHLLKIAYELMKYKHKNFDNVMHNRRKLEGFLICGTDDPMYVEQQLEMLDYQVYLNKLIA